MRDWCHAKSSDVPVSLVFFFSVLVVIGLLQ